VPACTKSAFFIAFFEFLLKVAVGVTCYSKRRGSGFLWVFWAGFGVVGAVGRRVGGVLGVVLVLLVLFGGEFGRVGGVWRRVGGGVVVVVLGLVLV
jgi:hypothetical protein